MCYIVIVHETCTQENTQRAEIRKELFKQIGVKRKALIGFMVDHGYLYRDKKGNLLPYANKKSDGLFDVKQSTNQKTGWAGCQTLLTPKGVETFRLLCQGL